MTEPKQAEPSLSELTPKKESKPGKWADTFFEALANCGVVRVATEAAGIERQTAYLHRAHNAAFRRRWDEALDKGVDLLEFAAHKLALEGNPTMLIFLLKCHRPDTYGDRVRVDVHQIAEQAARETGLNASDIVKRAEEIARGSPSA